VVPGPRPFAVGHDGRDLAGLDPGGAGEHLVLLHPNGLCAGLFDPLARCRGVRPCTPAQLCGGRLAPRQRRSCDWTFHLDIVSRIMVTIDCRHSRTSGRAAP
jgi:hypothetical protein